MQVRLCSNDVFVFSEAPVFNILQPSALFLLKQLDKMGLGPKPLSILLLLDFHPAEKVTLLYLRDI